MTKYVKKCVCLSKVFHSLSALFRLCCHIHRSRSVTSLSGQHVGCYYPSIHPLSLLILCRGLELYHICRHLHKSPVHHRVHIQKQTHTHIHLTNNLEQTINATCKPLEESPSHTVQIFHHTTTNKCR